MTDTILKDVFVSLNDLNRYYEGSKIYTSLDEMQIDLDAWLAYYNAERTHKGKCVAVARQCKH